MATVPFAKILSRRPKTRPAPGIKPHWLVFALLILLQFGLFSQYAKREIIWAYPGNYDQVSYLSLDAMLYRDILRRGPAPALKHYLHQLPPTGFMLPLQDSLLHFVAGPGRLTALSLNFFYFALLQIVFFTTARWLTGRASFGWIGVGLLMMQQTAFLGAGGLFDCRIDFIVYSLYGIFVCFLVRSEGLRNLRWLAAAVGCALMLICFRFITFSYLLGFSCTLVTGLLGLLLVWRRARLRQRVLLRLALRRGVGMALVFLLFGGTLIYSNWQAVHDYYVVGHFTSSEKHIRANEMGVHSLAEHLTFYFKVLFREHFGVSFTVVSAGLAVLALVSWLYGRRTVPADPRGPVHRTGWLIHLLVIGASIFAPWFILTLDESKSPLVVGVIAPPCALLLLLLVARFVTAGRRRPATAAPVPHPLTMAWWGAAAVLVLALGVVNWMHYLARQGNYSARRASVEQILALYDYINEQSHQRGFVEPRLSTDLMLDWNVPNAVNVSVLERSGSWLGARAALGYAIFALPREEIMAQLAQGDITMLSTFPKIGPYPIAESIRPLVGEMSDWCETHLLRGRDFAIDNGTVTVYFRPNVDLQGLSGEWMTPDGVSMRVPAVLLDTMRAGGKNTLVLEGPRNAGWLKQAPEVRARFANPADPSQGTDCPAEFILPGPVTYRIKVDLGALLPVVPEDADAVIALSFTGAYFVPVEIGINTDTRHLIVSRPTAVLLE